jgi:hypothetical protein
MVTPQFYGLIGPDRKLALDQQSKRKLPSWLATFKPGAKVRLIIEADKQFKKGSDAYWRYYRGVVVKMIAESTGNEPDAVHEEAKVMFNRKAYTIKDPNTGEEKLKYYAASAYNLPADERAEFIEKVRVWGMEFCPGLYIPLPGEAYLPDVQ